LTGAVTFGLVGTLGCEAGRGGLATNDKTAAIGH